MNLLSAVASIISILQLSAHVVSYLNDFKHSSKDRAQRAIKSSDLLNPGSRLEKGAAKQSWYAAIDALAIENGPLDRFKQGLETLQTKMTDSCRVKEADDTPRWNSKNQEIERISAEMERPQTLIEIALHLDHL
jgi:hypothetical protein